MDDIDAFVNSLLRTPQESTPSAVPIQIEAEHTPQETYNISEDDIREVLQEFGFQEESEESGEVGEEVENTCEVSDTTVETEDSTTVEADADSGDSEYEIRIDDDSPIDHEAIQRTLESVMAASQALNTPDDSNEETHEVDTAPLIPINSPTLVIDETTSRFSGTEWYNEIKKQRIVLAGLGGIGSWTALQLARMSPSALALYDNDTVEAANMSGQLYGFEDIGKLKVNAVTEMIKNYTSMGNVYAIAERFTENTNAGDIMICGFDNMYARRTFFKAWHGRVESKSEEERKKCLYIDGRLSIDTLQVFCIAGDDDYNIDRYQNEFLFEDYEADETVCSMKQTTYLASMIGSFIVNLFTNWCASLLNPIIPYDLPFFTEYDAQNMIFKTER